MKSQNLYDELPTSTQAASNPNTSKSGNTKRQTCTCSTPAEITTSYCQANREHTQRYPQEHLHTPTPNMHYLKLTCVQSASISAAPPSTAHHRDGSERPKLGRRLQRPRHPQQSQRPALYQGADRGKHLERRAVKAFDEHPVASDGGSCGGGGER